MIELVLLVVIICSVIQSVFGMGLLVFGTPSLLLIGLDFTDTLSYLLPASIAVSAIQVLGGRRPARGISPDLWKFCVPMIGAGLALSIFGADDLPLKRIVGTVLLVSVAGIAFHQPREILVFAVIRHSRIYHAAMGFIHGLSNMGGSLLSVHVASVGGDKEERRYIVAYYYLVFGVWQVVVLLITGRMDLSYNLSTAAISVGSYLLLGNKMFRSASEPTYKFLFAVFMAAYGAVLLVIA